MKKLFTVEDFIVAFVSAIAYGLSFEIPKILGWEDWQCGLCSMIIGTALYFIARKIIFCKAVQKHSVLKKIVFGASAIIFFIGQYISLELTGLSMHGYLVEQYVYIVVPAILGFCFSMLMRWYQAQKILKRYGDGSKGFVYDDILAREEMEDFNRQNQIIKGNYNEKLAVKTKTGIFVGEKYKKVLFYSGIPYAKPPVGNLRWKAPEPLPESDEVFEAFFFGASAIQAEHEGSILKNHRQSEDCLTLNIGFKDTNTKNKKPVIVLFHHGDFSYGGSADPLMYGEGLSDVYSDFVAVSFNYRLGIFGFIDFSEIPGGEDYPDALNLGLLDQIAALKWIKENISAFGGNPDDITAVGFEAGAASISLLAACEKAKGLFQKAFIFGGNPEYAYNTPEIPKQFAADLLKETATTSMQELQKLSTEKLKDAAQKLSLNYAVAPTCDGKLIPANLFKNYHCENIPFIVGIPNNENQIYKSFVGEQLFEKFVMQRTQEVLNYVDKKTAQAIQDYITKQRKNVSEIEACSKFCEQWNALCTYFFARKLAEGGNNVRLMYWNVEPLIKKLGAGTVAVASALLGNKEISQMYGNIFEENIFKIFQVLMKKFMQGEPVQLYNNEINGVDAFKWENFPKALIVSQEKVKCNLIEYRLTEIQSLIDYFKKF